MSSIGSAHPNILLLNTHDSGRHFGCYGVEGVQTPAIDRLAAEGALCTRMFACGAHCAPARAALTTGLWPQHNGVMALTHEPWNWRLRDRRRHVSFLLRECGYDTVLFNFQGESDLADQLGFDQWLAKLDDLPDDEMPSPDALKTAPQVADAVEAFLHQRGKQPNDKPFYAQVAFFETHMPWDFGGAAADDAYGVTIPPWVEDNDANRTHFAQLQGAFRPLDQAVGRIDAALTEAGLRDNTIVVFTTDHGLSIPRAKCSLYDPGIEIAFMLRWPAGGITSGKRVDALLSQADVLPTLFDLAGLEAPRGFDGVSFRRALDDPAAVIHDEIFALYEVPASELRCVRTDRYKLLVTFSAQREFPYPAQVNSQKRTTFSMPTVQLFDLAADPNERTNLADSPEHEPLVRDLSSRLFRWLQACDDPILRGPVPTPGWQRAEGRLRELAGDQTATAANRACSQ